MNGRASVTNETLNSIRNVSRHWLWVPYSFLGVFCILLFQNWSFLDLGFGLSHLGATALFLYPAVSFVFLTLKQCQLPTIYSFPLGYLLLGMIYHLGANLGTMSQSFLLVIPVLLMIPEALSGFSFIRHFTRTILSWFYQSCGKKSFLLTHSLLAATLGLFFWSLVSANGVGPLYPSTTCDVALFHTAAAKTYIQNGEMTNTWWLRVPFIPQLNHMVFSGIMAAFHNLGLRADLGPALLSPFIFLGCAIGAFAILRNLRLVFTFAAICLGLSLVRFNLATSYMDLPSAMFLIYLFPASVLLIESPSARTGALVGLLASGAFVAKQLGAYFMMPIVLFSVVKYFMEWKWQPKQLFTLLSSTLASALSVFFITFYRNFDLTGAFLFPFKGFQVPNPYFWDAASVAGLDKAILHWKKDGSLLTFLTSFWEIISGGSAHLDEPGYIIGPIFIVSLLALLLVQMNRTLSKTTRSRAGLFLWIALFNWALWFHSSPVIRYLLPTLLFAVIALAWCLQHVSKRLKYSLVTLSFLSCVFSSFPWIKDFPAAPPPVERAGINDYYRAHVDNYATYEWLQDNTNKNALIYSYGDSCHWNHYPRARFGDWFGYGNHFEFFKTDMVEVLTFLKSSRIDFLIDNPKYGLPPIASLIEKGLRCLEPVAQAPPTKLSVYRYTESIPGCERPSTSITDEIRSKSSRESFTDFSGIPKMFR